MKLTLDIDLNTDSREQISMIANMLNQITNAARRPQTRVQPEVAPNTGSIGQGFALSPVDDAVVGVSIPAAEAESKDTPTPVKEAKRRKTQAMAEFAAPYGKEYNPNEVPGAREAARQDALTEKPEPVTEAAAASTSESADAAKVPAAASTIDDVRAALQAFTAKHGVPAGIDLLKGFGAARISELKDADYAAFVEKCA